MIAQGTEMHVVLRLLCIASIIAGGIKSKVLDNVKREFLQVGNVCSSIANLTICRLMVMNISHFFSPWHLGP